MLWFEGVRRDGALVNGVNVWRHEPQVLEGFCEAAFERDVFNVDSR